MGGSRPFFSIFSQTLVPALVSGSLNTPPKWAAVQPPSFNPRPNLDRSAATPKVAGALLKKFIAAAPKIAAATQKQAEAASALLNGFKRAAWFYEQRSPCDCFFSPAIREF
jgi:hypothetical protein